MLSKPLRPALLFALATLLPASPAAAQEDANVQRGFNAEKVYAFGEIDSVNLFNGNLVLNVPLGGTYPVGQLAYGLVLSYNSNVWDVQARIATPHEYKQARPSGQFNAGVGFLLTLGQLHAPASQHNPTGRWVYVAEDGSQHGFYDTLHFGETSNPNVAYTRDGSYLRLTVLDPPGNTLLQVELPDGTRKTFADNGTAWRLISIRDRFGNTLTVTYPSATRWTLSDGHRTHHVDFVSKSVDGQSAYYVSRLDLAATGGSRAYYDFAYVDRTVERHCDDTDPLTDVDATFPALSTVTLPDGSTWKADDYYTTCATGTGILKRLILPTLGQVEWTFQEYRYPLRSAGAGGGTLQLTSSMGVATKRILDPSGACVSWDGVGCQWTYAWSGSIGPRKTTITYPTGDETVFWFSQPTGLSTSGYTGWEYGLPFHPTTNDGGGRYLSQEIYDGTAAAGTKLRSVYLRYERDKVEGPITNPEGWYNTNRRPASEKTVFHDDGGKYAETTWSEFDGVGHYRKAVTSGTFGAGDARTSYTGFSPERGIYDIVESTNANAGSHTYTAWPTGTNWVLATYDQTWSQEAGVTAYEQFCFENQSAANRNGYLLRHRVLAGASAGANDLVTVYSRDGAGNTTSVRHYGGDLQSLSTAALCSATFSADQYRVDHTYAFGARATSRWVDGAGTALPFYSLQLTIDANTALPTNSKDVSGIQTDYLYDAQGRLTWERPQAGHGAWVSYTYTRATSPTAHANVLVTSRPNGSTTGSLAQSRVYFDYMGRLWRDQRLGADGTWSTVDTVWNAMGWKRSVSEREPVWPAHSTTFKNFDPFGRPRKITPSDGSGHDVNLFYAGTREVMRQTKVRLAAGETYVAATERYDRQGRLQQVVEPSGAAGANVTTTYGYDVGGRLKSVSIAGSPTQTRTFNYDLRGFLTWERHPEKGASGNGYVRYLSYDALGNPGRKLDAVGSATSLTGAVSDLLYGYDRAGRLTLVRDNQQLARTLKQFTYGTANSGTDRRLGRLWTAERYNYVTIGATPFTVRVQETYVYAGTGGRTSARNTQLYVGGAAQEAFTQGWAWNDLGAPSTLTYPRCTQAGCTGSAATSRTVANGYTNGFLTSVTGFANTISYHPNGMVDAVGYAVSGGSALTYTQALDPNGMRRPASYTVTLGATPLWSSGAYAYDGAGNVSAIGSSSFTYDAVSRLTSGTVNTTRTGAAVLRTQTAVFDPFGNITTLTTNGSALATATSTSTNRLTAATYDSAGSMTAWNGNAYAYDPLAMAWQVTASGNTYVHMYTADEERIWTFQSGQPSRWTVRDLDGKVMRELTSSGAGWTVERDYIYRDGAALAAVTPTETTYLHPDHLGSPRLITNTAGTVRAFHAYYPFGAEATTFNQDTERMKFTGHERDLGSLTSAADDLDYMHARFCNPQLGRFLGVDPKARHVSLSEPQRWNRYSYALDNPLTFLDPDGEEVATATLVGIGIAVIATAAVINHNYQMQTNPEYREASISMGEAVSDAVGGVITAVSTALADRQPPALLGADILSTGEVTFATIERNTVAPGRGAPPPTAIPGQRPRTTRVEPQDAAADDPAQPPLGDELVKEGVPKKWQDLLDALENLPSPG